MKYLILISFALCLSFVAQAQSRVVTPSDVTTVVEIEKDGVSANDPLRKDASGAVVRTSTKADVSTVTASDRTVNTQNREVTPRTSVDMTKTEVYDIPKREKRKRDDR